MKNKSNVNLLFSKFKIFFISKFTQKIQKYKNYDSVKCKGASKIKL